MIKLFSSYMPVSVFGGEGALARESGRLRALGEKCLIVCGRNGARSSGALADAEDVLKTVGIAYTVFDEIEPNPNVNTCFRAAETARAFGADFVMGIGGGSALDACKIVALLARNETDIRGLYSLNWPNPALPIVCVGTTAGTGSEVTRVSVLTVDGRKKSITADGLFPTLSFCDPRYTMSCGYATTMSCGLDALSHALEGYFAGRASVLTDAIAIEAVKMLIPALAEVAQKYPNGGADIPLELRDCLYTGAILAGYVLNGTGTGFPHAMGYILTENYCIPHGYACAWFLPDYLELAYDNAPEKFARLGFELESLNAFIREQLPEKDISLSIEEICSLSGRFVGNKNFKNSPGSPDDLFGQRVLEKHFIKD